MDEQYALNTSFYNFIQFKFDTNIKKKNCGGRFEFEQYILQIMKKREEH